MRAYGSDIARAECLSHSSNELNRRQCLERRSELSAGWTMLVAVETKVPHKVIQQAERTGWR